MKNSEMMSTLNRNDKDQINKKGMTQMTNRIYTAKSSATRAMRKAIANDRYVADELEVRKVESGFQIVLMGVFGPMEFTDAELEARWDEFVNTPELINENIVLAENWFVFQKGAVPCEILGWFNNEYSEGLKVLQNKITPEPAPKAKKANALPANQKAALNALIAVEPLADKADGERADVWFPFKEIYASKNPCNLPKRSMGGIMRGLINRGLINFAADGMEYIGKKSVAVCITDAGLTALSA